MSPMAPGPAGPRPLCPLCKQNDRVEKASAIYIEGLSSQQRLKKATEGDSPKRLTRLTPEEVRSLSSRLAPPAAPTRVQPRPIHPDLVVVVFSLILPIFLLGIAKSQAALLFPILGFVVLVYLLYFFSRRRILKRFDQQQTERQANTEKIETAIKNWMSLYYCARDAVLFNPNNPRTVPIDEMNSILYPTENLTQRRKGI